MQLVLSTFNDCKVGVGVGVERAARGLDEAGKSRQTTNFYNVGSPG